jgi:hypothetical protein
MIQTVASWIPQRTLRVLGDSEYAGQSISRHLPANAKLISRLNMRAALYQLAGKTAKRGRRRQKGDRLPSPLQMAQNKKANWIKTTVSTESRSSSGSFRFLGFVRRLRDSPTRIGKRFSSKFRSGVG